MEKPHFKIENLMYNSTKVRMWSMKWNNITVIDYSIGQCYNTMLDYSYWFRQQEIERIRK